MTTTQISLEQLAEKLGGKLWIKGELKRIYLDRGYNTKKMSTKTYIYQREDGSFGVSCYIDCPSQDYNWIKSQQQQVIDGVMEDIEAALFEIENPGVDYYEQKQKEAEAKELAEARKEFEENIDRLKQNWASDYERSVTRKAEYERDMNLFLTMSDEQKNRIAELEAERNSILGTPGSAKRAKEIKNELASFPQKPFELNDWMKQAASFASAEEYVEFKLNEKKQSLGL